jgi:hypothetical protein
MPSLAPMSFRQGDTLADKLDVGRLPVTEALDVARQIALATARLASC